MIRKSRLAAAVAAVVVIAAGVAFWQQQGRSTPGGRDGGGSAAAGRGPAATASAPAVSVSTVLTRRRDWPVTLTATGTVTSLNTVEVRPQVSSIITQVHIREGQFVKAGQPLFSLDSRNDEANVAKAQAQLQKDEATLADAERQLARSRDLLKQNFVSQSAVDTATANAASQRAVVSSSRAAVAAARVSLGYNQIVAPSSGRAGAINVYAGTYVQPAGAALVTITQLDPIGVSFTLPQRNLGDALAGLRSGDMAVLARLPDNQTRLEGRLRFVDNTVDAASGTVKAKAVFDNDRLLLWPGAYVNVQLQVRVLKDAIVVPQAAIVQGATSKSLFVVGPDGRAAERRVEVVDSAGTEAVVTGVQVGERVVVEGRQNVRPGSLVRERQAETAGGGPGSASGGHGGRRGPSEASPAANTATGNGSGAVAASAPPQP